MNTTMVRTDVPLAPRSFDECLARVRSQIQRNRAKDAARSSDLHDHPVYVLERQRGERPPLSRTARRLAPYRRFATVGNTNAPAAKLTPDQVYAIRRRYDAGIDSLATIAADFGVSVSLVGGIGRGEVWTHLPEQPERMAS